MDQSNKEAIIKNYTSVMHEKIERWVGDDDMMTMFTEDLTMGLIAINKIFDGSKPHETLWEMDTAARDVVYEIFEQNGFELV